MKLCASVVVLYNMFIIKNAGGKYNAVWAFTPAQPATAVYRYGISIRSILLLLFVMRTNASSGSRIIF